MSLEDWLEEAEAMPLEMLANPPIKGNQAPGNPAVGGASMKISDAIDEHDPKGAAKSDEVQA